MHSNCTSASVSIRAMVVSPMAGVLASALEQDGDACFPWNRGVHLSRGFISARHLEHCGPRACRQGLRSVVVPSTPVRDNVMYHCLL